ncbi:TraK family protein [Caballeronia sp. LZ001]|uniref:TraK family protein n=1 Tax=Caballeronia sp. LZ001 TaxID=3038553 RepID=UPI00285C8041|nr:TraK family protein [Caballeronia sp. LZ001]MDR5803492.1 TraK family protein [Caballeronia sp. LZ001]
MEEMSLSQRIAAHVLAQSDGPSSAANRATFLGVQSEIERAIEEGWSVLAIHRSLQDEGVISFGYQAFRRYVKSLITDKKPYVSR